MALLVVVAIAGCGGGGDRPRGGSDGPSTAPSGDPNAGQAITATYDVTYKPGVVVFDGDDARAFVGTEDDGRTFRFAPSAVAAKGLAPGAIVLVAGSAFGRVTAVAPSAEAILVHTEPATLADVIDFRAGRGYP